MSCNKTIVNNYNYSCPTKTKYPCGCIAILDTGCIDYYGDELPKIGVEANTHTPLKDILKGINDAITCYSLVPSDTQTVSISISPIDPVGSPCDYNIEANVKVSGDAGNVLEARADGLYATGGSGPIDICGSPCLVFSQGVLADTATDFQIWTVLQSVPYPNTSSSVISDIRTTSDTNVIREISQKINQPIYGFISYSFAAKPSHGFNLILFNNGQVIWSQALVDFDTNLSGIIPLPAMNPIGTIRLIVTPNNNDSNGPSTNQGLFTVGGQYLNGGYFNVDLTLNGGGVVSGSPVQWPNQVDLDANYISYTTRNYSSQATDGVITITKVTDRGTNGALIVFKSSTDSSLDFTETAPNGISYSKTIPLTLDQLNDNDFMLTITPI